MTWECISPEAIEGFLRSAVYPGLVDGTDDGMLWNGSEEDGHVRSECEEDEGTDCADGDSDIDW